MKGACEGVKRVHAYERVHRQTRTLQITARNTTPRPDSRLFYSLHLLLSELLLILPLFFQGRRRPGVPEAIDGLEEQAHELGLGERVVPYRHGLAALDTAR